MKNIFVLFVALCGLKVMADPKDFYFRRLSENAISDADTAAVQKGTFDQLTNHDDASDKRTFSQRYYVDDTYAANGAASPVLFYLCGEATCKETSLRGAIAVHAKNHGAKLVALEHRYYGESQPFDSLTTENMKYLSTDNALKDAARFQKYLTEKQKLTGKWIVVGGSYPGSLSAYYRLKYPELVVGSLASSAPVLAKANFEEYDRHVAITAGPACLANIKKAVVAVEESLKNAEDLKAMKAKFQAEKLTDDRDFVYLVADLAALAIQYGYRQQFCNYLETDGPINGYSKFTSYIFTSWGIDALSMSAEGAKSLDPKDYVAGFGMRQWFYQSCTEYGYWQNAYHDSALSSRSTLINEDYHNALCKRLYGITKPVDTTHINETFYKPLLSKDASRILFTNGSEDPWSNLSLTAANGNTVNEQLTYYTIDKAAHCDDLRTPTFSDSAALKKSRSIFNDLIGGWLQ